MAGNGALAFLASGGLAHLFKAPVRGAHVKCRIRSSQSRLDLAREPFQLLITLYAPLFRSFEEDAVQHDAGDSSQRLRNAYAAERCDTHAGSETCRAFNYSFQRSHIPAGYARLALPPANSN